jgi:predicted butyrate kinase (DUF1464 family)
MRVLGIDPGTRSFDLFGMENDQVIIADESIESEELFEDPSLFLKRVEELMPMDAVIGPSGYGMPLKSLKDATEEDIGRMVPLDTKLAVNEGIRNVLLGMKRSGVPVWFTPGVIHLRTVPSYRKWNRFDMGTADKVCSVVLGVKDQSDRLKIPFEETSFVHVEVGYGFTAVTAVKDGRIVDGTGGTNGSLGFLSCGGMDAELAIRLEHPVTQEILFKNGLKDFVGRDIEPEELTDEAITLLGESIEKDVASMLVSARETREVLLSGRLIPYVRDELKNRLKGCAPVVRVRKPSKKAKEAACGAYIIGEGLLGGRYRELVENMGITA